MDYPELTLQAIDEQVAHAAREGRITFAAFLVTPEVATQVLAERAIPSRRFEPRHVLRLVAGDGDDPGELAGRVRALLAMSAIRFRQDGLLQDGRTSLATVAWAGAAATLLASFGHDPSAWLAVDTGKARPS